MTTNQGFQNALAVFREYCARRKMRYTLERELIIKEIYREQGHFNVEKLFASIRRRHPASRIAKTSIYRSVPHLLDSGILRQSLADAGVVVYERSLGRKDHDHFKCIKCGKMVEFFSPELESAQRKICAQENFQVLWRMNVINGICQECSDR